MDRHLRVQFQNFCKMNGIKHNTSAPYKPASDGQAERAVQIIKNGLSRITEGSIQSRPTRVLLNYHTRPHQTTSRSPAQLLMGRKLTTRLSLVHPDVTVQVEITSINRNVITTKRLYTATFRSMILDMC